MPLLDLGDDVFSANKHAISLEGDNEQWFRLVLCLCWEQGDISCK
jgi:hypothetical protein